LSRPRAEFLDVGRVVRPHGLKGLVVVELWTNREERMDPGSTLTWSGGSLMIVSATRLGNGSGHQRWLVSFDGIAGRDGAEALRGTVLRARPLDDAAALWVDELIGAEVFDSAGTRLGTVEAVEFNPASDLLVLGGGRLIPLGFVTSTGEGRVAVEIPEGLLET